MVSAANTSFCEPYGCQDKVDEFSIPSVMRAACLLSAFTVNRLRSLPLPVVPMPLPKLSSPKLDKPESDDGRLTPLPPDEEARLEALRRHLDRR